MRARHRLLPMLAAVAFAAVPAAIAFAADGPPSPCEFPHGPVYKLLEEWTKSCGHPLCGHVYTAEQSRLKEAVKTCDAKDWLSLKEDVRATVVGGGVVMFGEQHDNPTHHDLRSRLGLSQFASSVFEQISVDKAEALDAFLASTKLNYQDGALDKLKAAIDWDKSGWQTYAYDPLLLAALKAQVPFFAGDASRATIKAAAKDGEGAIDAAERARLKLDEPLGEKADAAVADDLYEAHCKMMERSTLAPMAFAQRYRDAILADSVLNAIAKRSSTLLLAGNAHVRKDRGVPWYIAKRAPDKKVLSVQLIEVEDGKTDPEAYVPKDPDGKPAADYVIFTPKAEKKDNCAELKAK